MVKALLKTMRPKQWTKNVFVFAALVFDKKMFNMDYLGRAVAAFFLFCMVSGVVYVLNDIVDAEKDRLHPKKKNRPIASGTLPASLAAPIAAAILVVSLILSFLLSMEFGVIILIYFLINVAYSFSLKHIVIVDVLTIAAGFVLRVAAGTVIFPIERFSPWLYVCTILLALFLALSKRRQEIVLLASKANNHRKILDEYNLRFLDEMISMVSSTTIIAYALYTFSAPNLPKNHLMMVTVAFVIYGIFRYMYLIHVREETAPPDEVLLKDKPLLLDVVLWVASAVFVLYYSA